MCAAIADRTANAPAPVLLSVADKGTPCGLPPPLSLTDTAPLKVPREDDLKATVMVHDPFATTLLPQVFVWEKVVEPVIVILLMLSVVLPVLVSVIVCGGGGQVWYLRLQEKARLAGLNPTTVPVPFRLTFWGLPGALSLSVNDAARDPCCVGWNVTLIVQFPVELTELPQLLVSAKSAGSAPVTLMLVMLRLVEP